MRHSIHLFIGEEMVSIAETISNHLKRHSNVKTNFAHVASWNNSDGVRTVRIIGNDGFKVISMEDDQQGAYYMAALHDRIINIAAQDDYGDELYLCIYVQLYEESITEEINKVINWCKESKKSFLIDVYGLADDVAKVFCTSTAEEHALIKKAKEYATIAKDNTKRFITLKDSEDINRLIVLQNCNLSGIGLGLDKNTLIKVLGEFALLTTEQFSDLFPMADFNRPDVTAFGISALWFDKFFFTDYLLSHTYLYVMERENVSQRNMDNPLELLIRAKKYIKSHCSLLSLFYNDVIKPNAIHGIDISSLKIKICNDFQNRLDELKDVFLSVLSDDTLSLPEKRAMLALFIREDDELLDDNVLLEELPTIDDCFEESLSLYVDEENLYEEEGKSPILSGPRDSDGKVYLPLAALKASKAEVRKSQSFIRKCEKRLCEIKEAEQITEDSKKRLTSEGFTYGETTYHLQHDIVEKPLEKTYIPNTSNVKKTIDLRTSFSSIRNQGQIGSCTAFSTTSIFEFILNQAESKKKHRLSPRFLYFNVCKKNDDGTPIDNGSSLYDNIESLGHDGVCIEEMCPYEIGLKAPSQEAIENASKHLVTEAKNVIVDHCDLTSALSEGYPVAISLKVFNSFGSNKNGFVFRPTTQELNSTDFGYHAMVICGYSEDKKIYIVRNSWGEDFGDNGYCYIPFSYIEDNTLCRQACIITGVNCNQCVTDSPIDEVINFDEDAYAIEYAITRILKEEEEYNLQILEGKYNSLNGEYIKLVRELTNLGKRGILTDFAVDRTETKKTVTDRKSTKEHTISKPRFGREKFYVPLLFIIVSLLLYASGIGNLAFVSFLVALITGVWMFNATKDEIVEEMSTEVAADIKHHDAKLAEQLRFICAGQAIDVMSEFRNDLERKHRYLSSFIGHFSMWHKAERKSFSLYDDRLKPPFNTILTKTDFEAIFKNKRDSLTGDIWLWKEFEDYLPTEEKAREFQNRLKNKIRDRIEVLHHEFSMSKFLMDSEKYDYLLSTATKREKWLGDIENQSVPFVQCSGLIPNPRKVVFIHVSNSEEKQDWNNFIVKSYISRPSCAYGGSPYKLTYVQIQPLRKEEVKFLKE